MSVPPRVAEVLSEHVTLEVQGIDRMYLNVYVPGLQREQGVVGFFPFYHRGNQFVSRVLMGSDKQELVAALEEYARREKIPVIQFRKSQPKDNLAAEQRRIFKESEGVAFIGKAQEKTPGVTHRAPPQRKERR